ncbi:peptidoglycan recognition protein-like [Melitaea cinxia]|uniref:peptidoglycan recognition protein-like n=1 Tax=Melitaea cinxia TaxID=113334 RepID=UPI001E26E904|nr:peptidoglycan recognition protein-like [Melitaea cinxia]
MFFKLILFSVAVHLVYVTACPTIVSRDEWGGYDPIRDIRFPGPVDIVVIQHTATSKCSRDSTCKAMIQGIEDYHVDTLFYNSIGMNFLIGGNGKVYEGAGWEQIGTHTAGYNHRSIAISFIGNYEHDNPTDAQLKIAQELIRCGVEKKYLAPNYHLVGHRQLIATVSPGRNLYRIIRGWPNFLADVSSIRN